MIMIIDTDGSVVRSNILTRKLSVEADEVSGLES